MTSNPHNESQADDEDEDDVEVDVVDVDETSPEAQIEKPTLADSVSSSYISAYERLITRRIMDVSSVKMDTWTLTYCSLFSALLTPRAYA